LVAQHLLPLHRVIIDKDDQRFGVEGKDALDLKFDANVAKIFKDVGPTLYEIYKVNFPHEIGGGTGGQGEDVHM